MRKKQHKEIVYIVGGTAIVGVIIQRYLLSQYFIDIEVLSNVITFLSIAFGFYVTSFTIFATSSYVSDLYKVDDKDNPGQPLMFTLIFKYKTGLLVTLFSILYFMIMTFILEQNQDQQNECTSRVLLNNIYTYPIISVFILNFIYTYKMVIILIKVIKQEAKNRL